MKTGSAEINSNSLNQSRLQINAKINFSFEIFSTENIPRSEVTWRKSKPSEDNTGTKVILSQGDPVNISEKTLLYWTLCIYNKYIHISVFYRKCVFDKIFVLNNTAEHTATCITYLTTTTEMRTNVMKYFLPVIWTIQIKQNC